MSTTVRYDDRTLRLASRVVAIAALVGIVVAIVALVGMVGRSGPAVAVSLVFAVFCGFVAFFYRSAVAVEVEVGPDGITKRQGLGLGWHAAWPTVTQLVVLPLERPRLVVLSPVLPPRRGLNEWPLRGSRMPRTARSVPATSQIVQAVTTYSGRQIDVRTG